jgi:hypothetical protein
MAQTSYSNTRTIGFAGMLDGEYRSEVMTMRNDEASASIGFGLAVKRASTTDPTSAKLLTAITGEKVPGIVVHSHAYDSEQLDDDGVLSGERLNVAVSGRMLVACEDGCNVGDPLHVRAVAAGAEDAGALLAAADGTDTIDMTGRGVWETSASAGGLAWLRFDFLNPLT